MLSVFEEKIKAFLTKENDTTVKKVLKKVIKKISNENQQDNQQNME